MAAQVGRERIEETIDPELTIDRALETYQKKGYTREWINKPDLLRWAPVWAGVRT